MHAIPEMGEEISDVNSSNETMEWPKMEIEQVDNIESLSK
jgi:hypothetical protein